MDNKVIALVVTYNRKQLLRECIAALMKQTVECDICIIDNASTDGTQEALKDYYGKISYINTGKNLGGAGGFNRALREGVLKEYEYCWIMDDDCIPAPTALQELLEAAKEHPGFGFLSSKVIWTDGSRCCMNEQKLVSGSLDADTVQPCRQATFVSLLFSTKAVRQVGLPITDFFIWGDDVEYTRRMSSKFPCWYVPASVVLHKTANNAGSNVAKDSKERLSRYRYAYRNEVYIARSEGGSRILYQGAKVLYHIARVLAAAPDSKKERIAVIIEGTKEGLHFNPAVEKTI